MMRTITLLALALGLVVHGVLGCGIDWNLPKNHFDGVNEFGFVSIWENIGGVDAGDGLILPLNINFRSDRNTTSSTLGAGWHLALLDSNIVQTDERTFVMFDPAGPFRLFWRDAKNPSVLGGQAGWKAEIRGDTITAWADCGGIKLVFNKGRIALMQIKDKTFIYDYQHGQIAGLRVGNTTILKVERAPISDEVTGLVLANNQKIQIDHGDRPRVQILNDQQVVSGVERSLNKVEKSDGTAFTFEYAVDRKLNPTLQVGSRLYTWSPLTKLILSDNTWYYEITARERNQNVAIARTDQKGRREFWYDDASQGVCTTESGGIKKVVTKFTSGALIGKIRKVEVFDGKVLKRSERWSYDERGSVLRRSINENQIDEFDWSNNEKGYSVRTSFNGRIISIKKYDQNGWKFLEIVPGREEIEYVRSEDGSTIANVFNLSATTDGRKLVEIRTFDPKGILKERRIGDTIWKYFPTTVNNSISYEITLNGRPYQKK